VAKVSQEIGGASIELAEELTLLTAELSYLPSGARPMRASRGAPTIRASGR